MLTGLSNSVQIAVVATLAALAARRPRRRAGLPHARAAAGDGAPSRLFDGVFMLPLGVSAVTLGFGFLVTLDRPPLDLRASPWLVPIAQAMVALPLVVRTVAPVLRSVDDRQRQAAASLGAGPLRVLLSVDLPVGPARAAGRDRVRLRGLAGRVRRDQLRGARVDARRCRC